MRDQGHRKCWLCLTERLRQRLHHLHIVNTGRWIRMCGKTAHLGSHYIKLDCTDAQAATDPLVFTPAGDAFDSDVGAKTQLVEIGVAGGLRNRGKCGTAV